MHRRILRGPMRPGALDDQSSLRCARAHATLPGVSQVAHQEREPVPQARAADQPRPTRSCSVTASTTNEKKDTHRQSPIPSRELAHLPLLPLSKVTLASLPTPHLGHDESALTGLCTVHDDKDLAVVKHVGVTLDGNRVRVYDGHDLHRDRA